MKMFAWVFSNRRNLVVLLTVLVVVSSRKTQAAVRCLGYDATFHAGAAVYDPSIDPPGETYAWDGTPIIVENACSDNGFFGDAGVNHEFGNASSSGNMSIQVSDSGIFINGRGQGEGRIENVPPLCSSGGVYFDINARFGITSPVIARVGFHATGNTTFNADLAYRYSVTGSERPGFGTGLGVKEFLICPAGTNMAVLSLKVDTSAGGGACYFIIPGEPPQNHGAGHGSFSASVSFTPVTDCPKVALRALEVTQVIQDWSNSVPLIAGKRTYARAFLQEKTPGYANRAIEGRLRGFRGGQELPGSPLSALGSGMIVLKPTAEDIRHRAQSDLSLNFDLPEEWTTGTLDLMVDVPEMIVEPPGVPGIGVPPNGTARVTFTPVPPLKLAVIPIAIRGIVSEDFSAPSLVEIARAIEGAQRVLPVAKIVWSPEGVMTYYSLYSGLQPFADAYEIFELVESRRAQNPSWAAENRIAAGFLTRAAMRSENLWYDGTAERSTKTTLNVSDEWRVLAHEIGHVLGRPHPVDDQFGPQTFNSGILQRIFKTGACGEVALAEAENFPYFYGNTCEPALRPTLGVMDLGEPHKIYGFDRSGSHATYPGLSDTAAVDPRCNYDLMSYCFSPAVWMSDHNYRAMRNELLRWNSAPSPMASAPALASMANTNPPLIVAGALDLHSGQVYWWPVRIPAHGSIPNSPDPGPFRLQTLSVDNEILAETDFQLRIPEDGPLDENQAIVPFQGVLPAHADIRQVRLLHNNTVLSNLTASANPPQVQVLQPNGGESVDVAPLLIQWSASDPDQDPLFSSVEFSPDGGQTWRMLAVNVPGTNYVVDPAELRGTTQGRVRVQVSDGFLTATDISDAHFTATEKAPQVSMLEPQDGSHFGAGQSVVCDAFGYDLEDGRLTGSSFEWRSDRDGLLGTGEQLHLKASHLSEGTHLISVTVRDSAGNARTATNRITISRFLKPILTIQTGENPNLLQVSVSSSGGSRLIIEKSSNLVHWIQFAQRPVARHLEYATDTTAAGSTFYRARSLPLEPVLPAIAEQPTNWLALADNSVFLDVVASGVPAPSYQWYFNNQLLAGQTNETLHILNATTNQQGQYFVVISNTLGSVTSAVAQVTILATPFETLYRFGSVDQDGINGWGPLALGSDGFIYGCARNGSLGNRGCIFRIAPNGSNYTVLHRFASTNEGVTPLGGIIEGSDGWLYGTAAFGGSNGVGTIFKLTKSGSDFSVVYHFRATNDCRNPQAELMEGSDGKLYGTAIGGGGLGRGGIFRIDQGGSNYVILNGLGFGGADAPRQPVGGLLEGVDGLLYGTTELGGASNKGCIFKLNKDGTGGIALKSLGLVSDGAVNPNGTLVQTPDGLLYGTSAFGGAQNRGTIIRIATNGTDFAVLHSLSAGEAAEPRAGLTLGGSGRLYGASRIGGVNSGPNSGAIYYVKPDGTYRTLRTLNSANGDGLRSRSPLLNGRNGFYYGTTFGGGTNDQGTIFRYYLP